MANIITKMVASHFIIGTTLFVVSTYIIFSRKISKDCIGTNNIKTDLYQYTCPEVEKIVFMGVEHAVRADPRMAALLLRMHIHDCFVNGCDASLLLDDTDDMKGEKTATPNLNSLRGFEIIDVIKTELESAYPDTVSCADVVAIAIRDSVVLLGEPTWQAEMGRKDSLSASLIALQDQSPTYPVFVSFLFKFTAYVFECVGYNICS